MCKPSQNLKLCTCSNKELSDKTNEKVWQLMKDSGDVRVIGEAVVQYQKVDSTEAYLLNQLNNRDPFDFDYLPKEGDKLNISWNEDQEYYFVFRDFQWENDFNIQSSNSQAPQKPQK